MRGTIYDHKNCPADFYAKWLAFQNHKEKVKVIK